MSRQDHLLAEVWEKYPEAFSHIPVYEKESHPIARFLMDMMAVGSYYYYVINISDYSLQQVSDNTLSIHGLRTFPETLGEIIDLIHPDDRDYVAKAEDATLVKMSQIGFEHKLFLKSSYCFRMRVANGDYHLFHHQAIHLANDENGQLIASLNIHTDIQYITQTNNRIVLVSGIGDRKDYCQIHLSEDTYSKVPIFSKREKDVLRLIALGCSSHKIGERLFISTETVRVHRRSLLKKANAGNSGSLIKRCIEWGLL